MSRKTNEKIKEVSLIQNLEKTAQTLNKLVNFLSDENKDKDYEINKILMINHPFTEDLKSKLDIPYNFYIEGFSDFIALMKARFFKMIDNNYGQDDGIDLFYKFNNFVKNIYYLCNIKIRDIFYIEDMV